MPRIHSTGRGLGFLDGRYAFDMFDAIVDVNGNGDYTDIESAIDGGAKSIFVLDGTYTLSQSIDVDVAGIEITGETKAGTIIDGNSGNFDIFTITADNFSIRNLTINQSGEDYAGIATGATGITMYIERILFDNCDIAIAIFDDSTNCTINECIITGNGITTAGTSKISIVGGSSTITRIINCDITTQKNANDNCIQIGTGVLGGTDGGEAFIEGCKFTVTLGIGVNSAVAVKPIQITDCNFSCDGNSKGVELSAEGRIMNCHFTQTGVAATANEAIDLLTRHSEVIGCAIDGGFYNGITTISQNCRIMGNRIQDCVNDGILLTGTAGDHNIVIGNVLLNNTGYGVNITPTSGTLDGIIVVSNIFDTNTAGNINDGGANTQIAHNVQV